MITEAEKLDRMALGALHLDPDYMIAEGNDLSWLIAQLACWPTRVDEQCTTNMRFLMNSAAATLMAMRDSGTNE